MSSEFNAMEFLKDYGNFDGQIEKYNNAQDYRSALLWTVSKNLMIDAVQAAYERGKQDALATQGNRQ